MDKFSKIYISYSFSDKKIIDEIQSDFNKIGIRIITGIDVNYRASITESIKNQISESDYIIIALSDAYFKSQYCLYEFITYIKEKQFTNTLIPIIIGDLDIFTPNGKINYFNFWENKFKEQSVESLTSESEPISSIKKYLGELIDYLSNTNLITLSQLKKYRYKPILEIINYKENDLAIQLNEISNITDSKRKSEAINSFINTNPDYPKGYLLKANIFIENSKFTDAISSLNRAIKLNPQFPEAYFNRGNLFTRLQDFDKAINDYNKAISLNPNNADFWNNKGIVESYIGKFELSIESFEKAIALEQNFASAYLNLAKVYMQTKMYDKAIQLLKISLNKTSELGDMINNSDTLYNLGILYYSMADYELSETYFKKTLQRYLELNYKNKLPDLFYNIGLLNYKKGDVKSSIEFLKRGLEFAPSNKEINKLLELIDDNTTHNNVYNS